MSQTGDVIRMWRDAVMACADDLEAVCTPLLLPRSALEEIPEPLRYSEGVPSSGLPHVMIVLDLVRKLRDTAGDPDLERAIVAADEQLE